ncbi:MAG: isochorismate synthase [FCB group bacterium]|nr:isochorismate synthase [FCB group bacterium]
MVSETDTLDFQVTPEIMFSACVQVALEQKASFAAWSLPRSSDWQILISQSGLKTSTDILDSETPGFFIHPFSVKSGSRPLFLRGDIFYNSMGKKLVSLTNENSSEEWMDRINALSQRAGISSGFYTQPVQSSIHKIDQENLYNGWVTQAVETIRNTNLEKVVLARTYLTNDRIDPIRFFSVLRRLYPHAFVSLIATPEYGTWIGASPELLLAVNEIQQFRTVSLAGTEPVHESREPVKWTDKEFEEQAIVSRYILHRIRKLGIDEVHVEGPYTHQAGNVYHLRTDITGSLRSPNGIAKTSRLVEILHPTPAVCGRPKKQALKFIHATEPFHRKLYAGYLGPVNISGESRLYVNLRCLQILDHQVVVYAGAGITDESIPSEEWTETTLKCQTMLRGLYV